MLIKFPNQILALVIVANSSQLVVLNSSGEETVDQVRERIIAWSESMKSFDGAYSLTQYSLSDPAVAEQPPRRMRVKYRFQGDDRYIEITDESTTPENPDGILSLARYDGVVSQRADDERAGMREPQSGQINGSAWPLPEGAFLTPEELFGRQDDHSLAEWLADGQTILTRKEGMLVLSHRARDGNGVDIWLDEPGNVIRLEWVRRLWPTYSDEQIAAAWNGDPFEVRFLLVTLDLGSYKALNGVNFPTFARKAWWNTIRRNPSGNRSRDKKPSIEGAIASFTDITRHERAAQTLELYPDDTVVNARLPASKFKLDYVDGMLMRDWATREDYYYSTPWYGRPSVYLIALALLLGVSAGVALKRYLSRGRRRSHAHGR